MIDIKNIKNIPQCKKLIEKYRSITIEQIILMENIIRSKNSYITCYPADNIAWRLTGFGSVSLCIICCKTSCNECIHGIVPEDCTYTSTYTAIKSASNPEELLTAFKARADYLESLINIYEQKMKE